MRGFRQSWQLIGILGWLSVSAPCGGADELKCTPFEFRYLGPNVQGVLALRPADVFGQPGLKEACKETWERLAPLLGKQSIRLPGDLRPDNFDQVVFELNINVKPKTKDEKGQFMAGAGSMLIRMKSDFDWVDLVRSFGGVVNEAREQRQLFYRVPSHLPIVDAAEVCLVVLDARTVLISLQKDEAACRQFVRGLGEPDDRLTRPERAPILAAPIVLLVRNRNDASLATLADAAEIKSWSEAAKLLSDMAFFAVGFELSEGMPARLLVETKDPEAARAVATAFKKDGVRARELFAEDNGRPTPAQIESDPKLACVRLVDELLRTGEVRAEGNCVRWAGRSAVHLPQVILPWIPTSAPADR